MPGVRKSSSNNVLGARRQEAELKPVAATQKRASGLVSNSISNPKSVVGSSGALASGDDTSVYDIIMNENEWEEVEEEDDYIKL